MKKIVNFFFELGMLNREKHSGHMLCGLENPKSIAAHSYRSAIIAYILADLEGADPEKTACIILVHDITETRLRDAHKVSARYVDTKSAEPKVFEDQLKNLSKNIQKKWGDYFEQGKKRNTKEGIVAKDADWLEMAVSSRELICLGYKGAQNWIDRIEQALETDSAKEMLNEIKKTDINDWWKGLKATTYKKLKSKSEKVKTTM